MRIRKSLLALAMILMIIFVAGCGKDESYTTDEMTANKEESVMELDDEAEMEVEFAEEAEYDNESSDGNGGADLSNRKIIENRFILMESMKFDYVTKEIEMLVNKYFGYVENSQVSGIALNNKSRYNTRYGNYTLRIPAEYFSEFVKELIGLGNILNNNKLTKDVTMQYYDLEARISTLEVQEERLLELLESGGKLADILEIENKLADVRYQIESYIATLKNLDNQVRFGTIQLEIREVYEESVVDEPAITIGERISKGFTHSIITIKNFFVSIFIWFITAIPYLLLWVLFILIIVFFIKRLVKKNEMKRKHHNIKPKIEDDENE